MVLVCGLVVWWLDDCYFSFWLLFCNWVVCGGVVYLGLYCVCFWGWWNCGLLVRCVCVCSVLGWLSCVDWFFRWCVGLVLGCSGLCCGRLVLVWLGSVLVLVLCVVIVLFGVWWIYFLVVFVRELLLGWWVFCGCVCGLGVGFWFLCWSLGSWFVCVLGSGLVVFWVMGRCFFVWLDFVWLLLGIVMVVGMCGGLLLFGVCLLFWVGWIVFLLVCGWFCWLGGLDGRLVLGWIWSVFFVGVRFWCWLDLLVVGLGWIVFVRNWFLVVMLRYGLWWFWLVLGCFWLVGGYWLVGWLVVVWLVYVGWWFWLIVYCVMWWMLYVGDYCLYWVGKEGCWIWVWEGVDLWYLYDLCKRC